MKASFDIKQTYIVFSFALIFKLLFIGCGYLSFHDELSIYEVFYAQEALLRGDFSDFVKYLVGINGMPISNLLRLPQVMFVTIVSLFLDVSLDHPNALVVFSIFNAVVSAINTLLLFVIIRKTGNNSFISLLLVLYYNMLLISSIYIRHIVPYEYALMFFLLAFYMVVCGMAVTKKQLYLIGVLCSLGFLTYNGSYILVAILIIWLTLINIGTVGPWQAIQKSAYILIGLLSIMLLVFLFSLGNDYNLLDVLFSSANAQVRFNENSSTFTFVLHYLYDVEGFLGIVITLTILLYFVAFIIFRTEVIFSLMGKLFISITVVYLTHASMGYFLHNKLFFTRLIHLFLPIYFISLSYLLLRFRKLAKARIMYITATIGIITLGSVNFIDFTELDYPRDILYRNQITNELLSQKDHLSTYDPYYTYGCNLEHVKDDKDLVRYQMFNFSYFLDLTPLENSANEIKYKKVYQGTHFQSHPIYYYEDFSEPYPSNLNIDLMIYKNE